MKPYIFTKDREGKIVFTEKELRKLLDDVYEEGKKDGAWKPYVWNPSWTTDKWTVTTGNPSWTTDKWNKTTISNGYSTSPYTSTTGTITLEEKK